MDLIKLKISNNKVTFLPPLLTKLRTTGQEELSERLALDFNTEEFQRVQSLWISGKEGFGCTSPDALKISGDVFSCVPENKSRKLP